jgi:hypothetical protein
VKRSRFGPKLDGVEQDDSAASGYVTEQRHSLRAPFEELDLPPPAFRSRRQAGDKLDSGAVISEEDISDADHKNGGTTQVSVKQP